LIKAQGKIPVLSAYLNLKRLSRVVWLCLPDFA
jgi:hypothetical protein